MNISYGRLCSLLLKIEIFCVCFYSPINLSCHEDGGALYLLFNGVYNVLIPTLVLVSNMQVVKVEFELEASNI